ncbi:hypothetical protein [Allonocardiopsis opalescens]|uniref:Uncharacterized protein with von Willebrand factor type A (VWA) domain n=1 Tax=Allonocardiopsis opalescens TaxID=1144618 RepID=A0A2T0QD69_9ACTN|nr:hypothetical protein [Allonocardiopsis opalescens]PRY01877.1 uncharacterized protein with von Willebrand factor type A (vWA) domain [Allonocardiopsis opalescens]
MRNFRYGPYRDGPDPLAPPYDVRAAVDAVGDSVMSGKGTAEALRELLRRGSQGLRGLNDLLRQVRRRREELRGSGRLDDVLAGARELLDRAVEQERDALAADPGDDARLREAELDSLPADTAQAVRQLADYGWRSPEAAATFEELRALLRSEILDSRFQGMKQALGGADPEAMRRVREMMADLNAMLDADDRGEHTQADFDRFMERHGDLFPDRPENLEELVDSLARRAAAAGRMLASLTPDQRAELEALMNDAMDRAGLGQELSGLSDRLRARRPDLDWSSGERFTGEGSLGMGDATTAIEELADLAEVEGALRQNYPGARLDDVDPEAVRRALGRSAVDDLARLRQIERELEEQGYLRRSGGKLSLTPKAVRRIGESALGRMFNGSTATRRGGHDDRRAGHSGEPTGASRPWEFGDSQPVDVVRTVRNAVLRGERREGGVSGGVRLRVEDFEVAETERRSGAAVCLLVDLSYSMALRGTWGPAKETALALHTLITTRFPQDAVEIIGFSNYARPLPATGLVDLEWDMVQGTNLHHALLIAGRHIDRHPGFDPIVLVVTDGEPTAHLLPDGRSWFDWPPSEETLALTLAEVDKMTRRKAVMNIFMLAPDERLLAFVEEVARRNGGRVFSPASENLGEYVVSDFLRSRRARSGG